MCESKHKSHHIQSKLYTYKGNNIMNTITTINTNTNTPVMMSSIEIAHHTGKSHSHVLRDIKEMFKALEIKNPELDPQEYQEVKAYNNMTKEILLNYRFTECLVTGYSPKLRLAV